MNEELIKKLLAERGEEANGPVKLSFSGTELKVDIEENTLKVVASTMGTADDRSGDVIFPGAYTKAIPGFLKNGFVAIGHDWDALPVAMPMTAEEVGRQLVCTATFHSTTAGQDARTVCRERLEAKKSVSVSVGFQPDYADEDGVKWFENGSDLLAWASGKGFDLSGFDQAAIKKLKYCRAITKIREWFEWSIVGVGMNRGAKAVAAKSAARKSLQTTVGAILQAKIHQSFTVAADELAIRGYMDTPERIALSSAISTGLKAFAGDIDPEVGERVISPDDVDWVASKSADPLPDEKTFDEQFNEALGCLDSLMTRWEGIAEKREALGDTHRSKLAAIVPRLEAIAAKSEPALGADQTDQTNPDAEEKAKRFQELAFRTLSLRSAI